MAKRRSQSSYGLWDDVLMGRRDFNGGFSKVKRAPKKKVGKKSSQRSSSAPRKTSKATYYTHWAVSGFPKRRGEGKAFTYVSPKKRLAKIKKERELKRIRKNSRLGRAQNRPKVIRFWNRRRK